MIIPARELMPVIRAALESGQRVRLTASGGSMRPFIRDGETVELEPAHSLPRPGDVVLVQCPEERYVLHRVVQVEGEAFFLRGDSQRYCEGPFAPGDVLGKVTVTYRDNGDPRVLGRGAWHRAGLLWIRSYPLGQWLLRLYGLTRQIGAVLLRHLYPEQGRLE